MVRSYRGVITAVIHLRFGVILPHPALSLGAAGGAPGRRLKESAGVFIFEGLFVSRRVQNNS